MIFSRSTMVARLPKPTAGGGGLPAAPRTTRTDEQSRCHGAGMPVFVDPAAWKATASSSNRRVSGTPSGGLEVAEAELLDAIPEGRTLDLQENGGL